MWAKRCNNPPPVCKWLGILVMVGMLGALPAWAAEIEHYSLMTVRFAASRTDTVVDEVWLDGANHWRLERRSDHWDNGLVAISDGRQVQLHIPSLSQVLAVPLSAVREVVELGLLAMPQTKTPQVTGEETEVLGKPAVLLHIKAAGAEVKRWIDKQTKHVLREERLDSKGRPYMVMVRNELPAATEDPQRFDLQTTNITKIADMWRAKAINAWVINQLHHQISLMQLIPGVMRLESAEVLRGVGGQTVVLRLSRGKSLISLFFAPATGEPPAKRRFYDHGLAVQAKRIGAFDVTLVGDVSTSEALAIFNQLDHQLSPSE